MPDFGSPDPQKVSIVTGTYSHANNTNEQTVSEYLALVGDIEISLDMNNLAQNTTIRLYEKVDGTNYRNASEKIFPTDFPSNIKVVIINIIGKSRDAKITFQSGTGEGSSKNVAYAQVTKEALT